MNLEGRLIGNRYEIIEKIGNGGMATVYKAKCHVLNRYVAVKILRDEFTTDEEFIKRFNTEAQAVACFTHPNIVSVYDVGNEGDLYYIVMELIQGKTLKEIIVEDGALSWKWSVNVAIQIASALETAHKNNIIHRDIKPHNIIITEEGIAKVTDFGIAKAVSNSTITAFGTTMGSVHYFSPEHARGGFTDAKSDLYSLGVVLYEMLTGRVPFDADTPVSVALKHMQEQPIEPIRINTTIPISVNKIVMKAMQKDTNYRYASATEMLKDLSLSLKRPDENFVTSRMQNDFPTQRIDLVNEKKVQSGVNKNAVQQQSTKKPKKGLIGFISRHKILTIFIAMIILFSAGVIGASALLKSTARADVNILNLVGISKEEAKLKSDEAGFVFEIAEEKYDPTVPEGFVISQEPAYKENYKIKEKSTIKVWVSLGQETVIVPKVVGLEDEKAIVALEEVSLQYEIVEESNKKVEEGYIIKQEPVELTEVKAGEKVKIFVSTGIEKVKVPNLVGVASDTAQVNITDAGLTLGQIIYDEDPTKNNGVVLKQSLEVGKEVEKESSINITINKLPEIKTGTVNINVSSLVGYTQQTTTDPVTGEVTPVPAKNVNLKVEANSDVVENKTVSESTTNQSVTVQGVGTITIKVYIDGVLKRTEQLNLNNSTTLSI